MKLKKFNKKGGPGSDGTEFAFLVLMILISILGLMFFNSFSKVQTTQLIENSRNDHIDKYNLDLFLKSTIFEVQRDSVVIKNIDSSNDIDVLSKAKKINEVVDVINEYFYTNDNNKKSSIKKDLDFLFNKIFDNPNRNHVLLIVKSSSPPDELKSKVDFTPAYGSSPLVLGEYKKNQDYVEGARAEIPCYDSLKDENIWVFYLYKKA